MIQSNEETATHIVAETEVLDALIVGGGPAGTAAAFRAKELGLRALVIDFDDILKRIRDYPKDKLILPDFGGGDRMAFPAGEQCIAALQFAPIDKDEICQQWKGLYESFAVPFRTGIELSSMERVGDIWQVTAWDHKKAEPATFRARHVVVALGRGVPRRFDIPGNVDGIAYRLDDPSRYITGPALVVGGGTSAAEAVVAISRAKIAAEEATSVYWAYRGTKMPRVSKALADQFFEAYIGNGNIRHFPESEPVSVVTGPDRTELLSLRVDRKTPEGRPPETVHLEFRKTSCIACIGEDIPEALLQSLGVSMVAAGPQGKKMMAVTPLLETQQPNVYLIGDLLSQSYLETDDFNAPIDAFRQVKHRGNIKSSLRDGVFVAEVIKQRLQGRAQVEVVIQDAVSVEDAPKDTRVTAVLGLTGEMGAASAVSPADTSAADHAGALVLITPAGIEADEYKLKSEGMTTLGRIDCDISFPQDTFLSDAHASISYRDGEYLLRDDGSRSGTYLRVPSDHAVKLRDGDLLRVGRQILVVAHRVRGWKPNLEHYDAGGRQIAVHTIEGTKVFGRSGGRSDPDIILDNADTTLSRFHMSVTLQDDEIQAQDFGSRNGTYLKIDTERKLTHRDVIRIGGQQLAVRLHEDMPEKTGSSPVAVMPKTEPEAAAPPPPPPVVVDVLSPVSAGVGPTGPHISFAGQTAAGPTEASKSLLEWADNNEVSIDYECWIGMCGCDAIRILSGSEFLNDVTEKEIKTLKRKGLEPGPCRLACMTKTSGPVVVEVIE